MGYILEGPDGAGKTTLAKFLVNAAKLESHHFGPPTKPALEEYLHWLVDHDPSHHRVIDRFHLGESIYGPLFRGTLPLSVPTLCTIEWALMVRGYTLVHVTGSLHKLVTTLEERGDDMVQIDQLTRIVEDYWEIMRMSFMPRIGYDWMHAPSMSTLVKEPLAREQESVNYSTHCAYFGADYPGTGSLTPKYVLVGERTNPNLREQSRAVPFAVGTAGDWLIRAIWKNRWQGKVYLTNAKKVNGDEDQVAGEIRWLRQNAQRLNLEAPKVITMGKSATRIIKKHKFDYVEIVHPSYHRRFHFNDGPNTYAQLLAAC